LIGTAAVNVLLTFDIEIWCGGWDDLDRRFPAAFDRYVYGRSRRGDYALPMTLQILKEHGIKATFFVEPLFACRFGMAPLQEIVGLIREAGQDVQLHVHPEWTDEARPPILANASAKRQHLFHYSLEEQTTLIGRGLDMLRQAGVSEVIAFRAGSYACNRATLAALRSNGVRFDSSVNPARSWSGADLPPEHRGQRIAEIDGVIEYPITVFFDRPGHLRQTQVGSSSLGEMKHLLLQAHAQGRGAFVIVSHNFEMLVSGKSTPDPVVVRRFEGLCRFLRDNGDRLKTVTFHQVGETIESREPPPLSSSILRTGWRTVEQVWRRVYG
jgi:peptidoglycan/xylan/chitin deacetylase (PgdA/CDA1 family)